MSEPVEIEELSYLVFKTIMQRVESGDIDTPSLIKLMPWVCAPIPSESKLRYDITHRFIVVKPELDHSQHETLGLTKTECGELEDGETERGESTKQQGGID